jgi:hypothetical protein
MNQIASFLDAIWMQSALSLDSRLHQSVYTASPYYTLSAPPVSGA